MYQSLKAKLILLNKNLKKKLNNIPTIEAEYKLFNCYKQKALIALLKTELKAKEQECEEWKAKYYNSTTIKQNKNLKKENEELKAKINKYSKINEQDTRDFAKYKQALDEIAKIAINDCENCCECTTEFNLKESCSIYEIQNIINKAKD